ncbi:hypothetical protein ACHAWU_010136 [Discostella pseudostelligera]|uniref:RRN7-type domain-containing protein n=1 Tax=Discostella pseudostelligera TaxID=259834 RepID=A0ABD3MD75_9STRA
MSFYLDDYPDDDNQTSNQICPNCSGTDFYSDPVSGTLTCSSCYTQSQTATQEEFDYDEKVGLIAKQGAKHRRVNPKSAAAGGGAGDGYRGGKIAKPPKEYDRSKTLPNAKSCCLAFQWLLRDASKCAAKLAGIQEEDDSYFGSTHGYHYYDDGGHNSRPSILEKTVEKIWFAYLQTWMKSTQEFSAIYPEMRVSFRDYFLSVVTKVCVMKHLSLNIGKKIEAEIVEEMQKKAEERSVLGSEKDDDSISSEEIESGVSSSRGEMQCNDNDDDDAGHSSSAPTRKRKQSRRQMLTVPKLSDAFSKPVQKNQHPNGIYNIHPHHAVLKAPPSLTLILSILQLALTHLQTGVAPHHLTMWAANGQLPQVLDGYSLLPTTLKNDVQMAKSFFSRSHVPPSAVVENLANMLAAATSWFEVSPTNDAPECGYTSRVISRPPSDDPRHRISLYNVPLLTARIIQDLGFDQRVLDISLALMGVRTVSRDRSRALDRRLSDNHTESSNSTIEQIERNDVRCNPLPPPLQCAHFKKLYTPLHVAAVIIVACKLSPGWETWQFTNLHRGADMSNVDAGQQPSPAFVPWQEAQLPLLGNGSTLNHYLNFLENSAFSSVDPTDEVAQFFQNLERGMTTQLSTNASKPLVPQRKHPILPNELLSGASNPNEPTLSPNSDTSPLHTQCQIANNIGRYTAYQRFERKKGRRRRATREVEVRDLKPYHPHYCRLVEYVCYIIEEADPEKLHSMVEDLEVELLMTEGS